MALIEANGRPHIVCGKCRGVVVWPHSLSPEQMAELAAITRADALDGAHFAARHLGLGPRESKALALHITKQRGRCHRCNRDVSGRESLCSFCRSANLDW
jgi:hypothetical protein